MPHYAADTQNGRATVVLQFGVEDDEKDNENNGWLTMMMEYMHSCAHKSTAINHKLVLLLRMMMCSCARVSMFVRM